MEAYFPLYEGGHHEFKMCRTWPPDKPQLILKNNTPALHSAELGKLQSSVAGEDSILRKWLSFMLPSSNEEWDTTTSEDSMFTGLKKKVEAFSADPDLSMQQDAIDEGRMGHQIELAGAFHLGKEEGIEEARAEERCKLRATI